VRGEVQCFMEALRSWRYQSDASFQQGDLVWADLGGVGISALLPDSVALPAAGGPVTEEQVALLASETGLDVDALISMGLVVPVAGASFTAAFPIPQTLVSEKIEEFFNVGRLRKLYAADVGTVGLGYLGSVTYVRQRLAINVPSDANLQELEEEYQKWVSFVEARNMAAPLGGKMIIVSPWIIRLLAELDVVSSTLRTISMSVCGCFVIVAIFTRDWLLSLYTVLTTVMSILSLLFFIVCVFRWEFGAIQVIGFTTFIGLAVDYTVHTVHAYQMSDKPDRRSRVTDVLKHAGVAIVGGAFTTGGATVFLLPCLILPFFQLGVMLILNTTITVCLTFFFLMPALMICGPMGQCGRTLRVLFCMGKPRPPPSADEGAFEPADENASEGNDEGNDAERAPPTWAHNAAPTNTSL